jgi:methionyl-tRNA formyltransferase
VVDALAQLGPDLIVVTAFGQKLRHPLLDVPRRGCINVHFSLLPRHRGAAPVAYAILEGDPEAGVTIMRMAVRMDAGDILHQEATPIGPRETTGQLTERLAAIGARLLTQVVADVEAGHVRPTAQDHGEATLAPSLRKKDGAIDWSRSAAYLERFVRAMTPWPGAFTFWARSVGGPLRLVVLEARPAAGEAGEPGRVASVEAGRIAVETGGGLLHIFGLQPAGKKPMTAAEFLRGHSLAAGDRFESPND